MQRLSVTVSLYRHTESFDNQITFAPSGPSSTCTMHVRVYTGIRTRVKINYEIIRLYTLPEHCAGVLVIL